MALKKELNVSRIYWDFTTNGYVAFAVTRTAAVPFLCPNGAHFWLFRDQYLAMNQVFFTEVGWLQTPMVKTGYMVYTLLRTQGKHFVRCERMERQLHCLAFGVCRLVNLPRHEPGSTRPLSLSNYPRS